MGWRVFKWRADYRDATRCVSGEIRGWRVRSGGEIVDTYLGASAEGFESGTFSCRDVIRCVSGGKLKSLNFPISYSFLPFWISDPCLLRLHLVRQGFSDKNLLCRAEKV